MNASIVRVKRQKPANDNGAPAFVPMFDELLRRHDVKRSAVLVYGAVALFEYEGHAPNVGDVAIRIGMNRRSVERELSGLVALGLMAREHRGGKARRARYVTRGPKYACCAA